jgi:rhamnogalacturonyl hydrolase YesR
MNNNPLRLIGLITVIISFATGSQLGAQPAEPTALTGGQSQVSTPASILTVMQRVADWQLAHPDTNSPTSWPQGAGNTGMMALAGISGDAKYRDAMLAAGETNGWQLGPRFYDADDYCAGQAYAELYFLYRENRMIAPLRERFDAILAKPPDVQSLEFTKAESTERKNWSWCDSLFMGPPTWLRLYAATDDERYLDFAVTNWWRTTDYLYDRDEHLFFRDSTYFDRREANGKKVFWSRGNGWVIAGLVRVLQFLPSNHPDRPRFEQLFREMAGKILACQQPDGLWRSSLLDPESYPSKETSGSGFFTYALAWGVNQGLLDRAKFEPAVRRGWTALVGCVNADGKLTHVQPIGSTPKTFADDSTGPYGVGAFLLAGSEVYRMAVFGKTMDDNGEVIPLILFRDTPLKIAIWNLARQAGIQYRLDPDVVGESEPTISVRWTCLTGKQALQMVLDNYNLQMVQDSDGKFFRISKSPLQKSIRHFSSPIILKVTNLAVFRRDCETVEFNLTNIYGYSVLSEDKFPTAVMDGLSSRILDSQIYTSDSNSNSAPDKLLFQVDLAPGETRTFYILDASALAAVPPPIVKTFARFVPERYDDFAWESDRIAHRAYGLALIKAEGTISSGPDVWIKRDRRLIVDTMYGTGHYHQDNGEFMDDYRVGHSRGCGGLGIWDGKKLYVSSNYHNWRLITTGPIRSEFELTYDAWDAGNGRMVSETKRYSIDAGSWFTRAQSTFNSDDKSPLTIAVGLAERACGTNGEELVAQDQTEGWMSYWQPEDKPKGIIGDAIILPKGSVQTFTNDTPDMPDSKIHADVPQPTHEGAPPIRNLLAIAQVEAGQPFEYYFGACWNRSGDFTNRVQWENYVKRFAERRDQPLQVTVGNE